MKLNFNNTNVEDIRLLSYQDKVIETVKKLENMKDKEDEFVGWYDLPINYSKEEIEKIKKVASNIQKQASVLLVIGIGGSYLGSKAITDILNKSNMEIIYVGNNLSSTYITNIINYIKNKEFVINVISKSGTTLEPAIAFRIFKEILEDKYKEDAKNRIYVTTDSQKGALKQLAIKNDYETFVIPSNVGGRYSLLTACALFPLAVCNIDIEKLLEGAQSAYYKYRESNILNNDCYKYAVIRNILYNQDKIIEIFTSYEPMLHSLGKWWQQLYGESEGKEKKGIFPAVLEFTTDLHSMGQYIQDGRRNIFETVIKIDNINNDIILKSNLDNLDNLNYLEGKSLNYINNKAMEGTILAHTSGGVDNILITLDKLDEKEIGSLIYFFEKTCAISSMLMGVNPFNQPGVEAYKKNMFKLLGRE